VQKQQQQQSGSIDDNATRMSSFADVSIKVTTAGESTWSTGVSPPRSSHHGPAAVIGPRLLDLKAVPWTDHAPLQPHIAHKNAAVTPPIPTRLGTSSVSMASPSALQWQQARWLSLVNFIAGALTMPSVLGAWALASGACVLAYIHQAYVFSLSYGLSMAAIGGSVLYHVCPKTNTWVFAHAVLLLTYGLRLFTFLLWRQVGQDAGYGGPDGRLAKLDKTPTLERTPLIVMTALFYALMASPLVYHAQAGAAAMLFSPVGKAFGILGVGLAAFGLMLEAVADQQKSMFKIQLRAKGEANRMYMGGVYSSCRHPNYSGEILFWLGSFFIGVPALISQASLIPFYQTMIRATCAVSGLFGIVMIMTNAAKRLDMKQAEAYAASNGDDAGESYSYDEYRGDTFSLFPCM
jgi:steroid 5-alpha reductase family enzyme